MGCGGLTSSQSVKADDTEGEANEQMMGSGGRGGGGYGGRGEVGGVGGAGLGADSGGGNGLKAKREGESFSHCQMEEQLASLITAGTGFLPSNQHARTCTHVNTHTRRHTHAELPPVTPAPPAQHLVIKERPSVALHFSSVRMKSERRQAEAL